jgi:putative oxidoreductase
MPRLFHAGASDSCEVRTGEDFVTSRGGFDWKSMKMDRAASAVSTSAPRSYATTLERLSPYVLSILRIMAGLLFLEHGTSKLFGFPPHGPMPHLFELEWFAGMIEFCGGTLVALGLFTRPAAFLMSGEMAIGYFMFHAPRSFFPLLSGGEAAVLYCFVFLYFVFAGAGPWSLDAVIWRKGR